MRPDSMQERLRLANNSDKHKAIDDWALEKWTAFGKYGLKSRPEHTERAFWAHKGSFHGPFQKNGLN